MMETVKPRSDHSPWTYIKDMWIWHFRARLSGGLGRTGLMVGLKDLKGLFQPKLLHDFIFRIIYNLSGK